MKIKIQWFVLGLMGLCLTAPASAAFHLWRISEIYSNADGTVQFIELVDTADFDGFLAGHTITSTNAAGTITNSYTFPTNLPSTATANKRFLIGTAGVATAPGGVTPDYIVPNNFLFPAGGTINFALVDIFSHGPLPTDGTLSLNRDGTIKTNSPTNFAGVTRSILSGPVISGFWPASGGPNTGVLIFGANYYRASTGANPEVRFNGIQSNITQIVTNDFLFALLPSGATQGFITVKTDYGLASSAPISFGIPPGPDVVINGLWPGVVTANQIVFVFGANFCLTPGCVAITISGKPAPIVQILDPGVVLFMVPAGAATGPVCATVPGKPTACSSINVFVTP
jgi:hypothetical protein